MVWPPPALSRRSSLDGLHLMAEIEMRGGLVEDEERRLLAERAGQHHALSLAAAQPVEPLGGEVEHACRCHRPPRLGHVGARSRRSAAGHGESAP